MSLRSYYVETFISYVTLYTSRVEMNSFINTGTKICTFIFKWKPSTVYASVGLPVYKTKQYNPNYILTLE